MRSLVLVVYSASAKSVQRFCEKFESFFKIVVVYNGSDSEFSVSGAEVVLGSNVFREFSGYVEGARKLPGGNGLIYFCNDTLILNKQAWKLKFLLDKTYLSRVKTASMFGFKDPTFNMSGNVWFVRNRSHLRSDVFALNENGVGLLEELMGLDLESLYCQDEVFREVCNEFIRLYHPNKSDQKKGLATYIELSLSRKFFEAGLLVDFSTQSFKVRSQLDKFLLRIMQFNRR